MGPGPEELGTLIAMALRRERERAGLSLTELAKRAGVAKSTLSKLESGAGNPSVEVLWALATALGVTFSRLVDPPRPTVRVVRAGEGPVTHAEQAGYAATLLASCPPGARRDLYRIVAWPGPPRVSEPHIPGTLEHVVLAAGRALVGPADDPVEMGPGDYVAYPGDARHVFEALEPDTSAMLVMEHV
ncbi:XRE family transcriptional regulator [Actinomadura kijaniata]|uniref:Transcriptional regulator with XRE-family HTH domain n=1 Tax=Actinomadura namibiensis TaxID=182080 RepID=A0A7W3LSD6_ACTNM|nr:XRE family transcriptional regulator [Actinomadura namibiensis]MBA8953325.1 transcriptional regulator with XRE-family HTH domain [Actinomadura namibiensis]